MSDKIQLPIADFRDEIVAAVDQNQVTIITAETGAGKSTQVPQYLAEHSYSKVIVTQPRILAARNLSRRVREEWAMRTGKDSDNVIGYRTAHERDDNPSAQILYCTDGLQLVREITGSGTHERQVLVLDEVHEWNENMEVLVAWAKKRCQEEPRFKVVIMSATIETDTLADYFDSQAVITVPGRTHDVTKRFGKDVLVEIFKQIEAAHNNVLVFLPGKAEIQNVSDAIMAKATKAGVSVIPLHSQLEATAQQEAFASYPNGKIILATNIAQTSVTIDDVDVVIDSGLARQSEVRDGVEGLFIAQTSQADCLQRAGRAGRTKPGEYILAPYDTMACLRFDGRQPYGTPEILRKHIDRLTLRLANVGIDIELLDFYHDPSKKAISRAKRTLLALGALTADGDVTTIGRQMEQFPVESSFARMLIEAQKYSTDVQIKLAAIIGIQEVGGIVKGGTRYTGWHAYTRQKTSDLIAQYDVFLALPQMNEELLEETGIITKNVAKARDVMKRLRNDLQLKGDDLTAVEPGEQEPLMRSIVAGQIDQLWQLDEHGEAVHLIKNTHREISSSSVVHGARLFTGTPFDLQIPTHSGGLETLHLVQGITAVKVGWLIDLAPHLFASRRGKPYYDPNTQQLATRQLVRFGGKILEGTSQSITENNPENRRLFVEQFAIWAHGQLERERRSLGRYRTKHIPPVPLRQVQQQTKILASGAISFNELNSKQQSDLLKLAKLETYLGAEHMSKFEHDSSQGYRHQSQSRRWKPQHKRKYDRRKGR